MLVRGAEPMEKRLRRGLISSLLSVFLVSSRKFPSPSVSRYRSPQPNDRAERVSERGSGISPAVHLLLTHTNLIFHLLYVAAMLDVSAMLHFKSVYTPLALRDWFRAAPRNPLKGTDAPAACPTPRRPGNNSPSVPALSGGRIGRQTQQNAHDMGN